MKRYIYVSLLSISLLFSHSQAHALFDFLTDWKEAITEKVLSYYTLKTGTAIVCLATAGMLAKQGYDLQAINKKMGKSEDASAQGKDFWFGSWRYTDDGCRTASDILGTPEHRKTIVKDLWDKVPSKIDMPKNVNKEQLLAAMEQEQKTLRGYLDTISYLTDAPRQILDLAREQSGYQVDPAGDSYIWYQHAAFRDECVGHLANLSAQGLNAFGQAIITEKCTNAAQGIMPAGVWSAWRVWRYRLPVWYKYATKLYWKVYTRYLRVMALTEIVREHTGAGERLASSLDRLDSLIGEMLLAQGQRTVYTDMDMNDAQRGRALEAKNLVTDLLATYPRLTQQRTQDFTTILRNVEQIRDFIRGQQPRPGAHDSAMTFLGGIRDIIDRVKREDRI